MEEQIPPENDENWFSEDPEEQLNIENELLRLQLQAETGANIEKMEDLPPEVENMFLNQIINFERQLDKVQQLPVYQIIGSPEQFVSEAKLDEHELALLYEELVALLDKHNIVLEFEGEYTTRHKYKYLTEAFFKQEVQKFDIPDLVCHFSYEELTSENDLEVQSIVEQFCNMWFEQDPSFMTGLLHEEQVRLHGVVLTHSNAMAAIENVLHTFNKLENGTFEIHDCSLIPEETPIKAIVKGRISWDAILDQEESILFEKQFVFGLVAERDNWYIDSIEIDDIFNKDFLKNE